MYSIQETFVFQTEIYTFRIFICSSCCFFFLSSPWGSVCFFSTRSTRTCRCHGKWSFLGSSIFLVVKNPYDLRSQIRFLGSLRKTHPYCWFYSLDNKRVLTFPSRLVLDSPQISVSFNVQDAGRVLVPKIVLSFAQQNTPPLQANWQHVTKTPAFGA